MKWSEVYDLECLYNCFTYTGLIRQTGEIYQAVIHSSRNDYVDLINHVMRDDLIMIGYNNENYDYPLLHHMIKHVDEYRGMSSEFLVLALYKKSQEIIESVFTQIDDKNKYVPQIDLFRIHHFDNKARSTSLKDLEVAMNLELVEDMPFTHTDYITDEQIQTILDYNLNDVLATDKFLNITLGDTEHTFYKGKNKIQLRIDLGKKFNVNCLNLADVPLGDYLMLELYSREVNIPTFNLKKINTVREEIILSQCIPSWVEIKSNEFKKFITEINNTTLKRLYDPTKEKYYYSPFEKSIIFHGIKFDFGTGGAHGCAEPGIYKSNDKYVLLDFDVSSLYPSLAVILQIYPQHLGSIFITLYTSFLNRRLEEKKLPKGERDMLLMEGYKLILNGIYGKSGEENSWLFDKLYMMKTTIAGQLFIAMWAEHMVEVVPSLKFIQINTDGITIQCLRSDVEKIRNVNKILEQKTGLFIEESEYKLMVIRDVNNYLAQYQNGEDKLKGCFEIDKELHKDPSMRIVPYALHKYYTEGIDVKETIYNHKNIYDFCIRLKIKSGSKGQYRCIKNNEIVDIPLSKTTRYYVSNRGGILLKQTSKVKSGVTVGFNVTLFNKYIDIKNYDINYNFYIAECQKIIQVVDDGQLSLW